MTENTLVLRDGKELFYRTWKVEAPKATVHINHGMAEHSLRYDAFATYLNGKGFSVYAQDHRGHGRTKTPEEVGYFADKDGWRLVADDSFELDQLIGKENPGIPHFLFGHSMGSFVARTNASLHSTSYDAAIFMGTGASSGIVGKMGKLIASSRARKYGPRHKDEFLNNMAFGSYLKKFNSKEEGIFCWLSSDGNERKKYEEDPDCGFICSSTFYHDLIEGLETANDKALISTIRKDLPILFLSGDLDPVGSYGKGVQKAAAIYSSVGIKDVRVKLYKDGRHEILNDRMRKEVMEDVAAFYGEFI